jgi:hypothetical protein
MWRRPSFVTPRAPACGTSQSAGVGARNVACSDRWTTRRSPRRRSCSATAPSARPTLPLPARFPDRRVPLVWGWGPAAAGARPGGGDRRPRRGVALDPRGIVGSATPPDPPDEAEELRYELHRRLVESVPVAGALRAGPRAGRASRACGPRPGPLGRAPSGEAGAPPWRFGRSPSTGPSPPRRYRSPPASGAG